MLRFVINEPRKNCESFSQKKEKEKIVNHTKTIPFLLANSPSSEVDRVLNFVHKNIMWYQRVFTIF